jgi:hypothetical protein
MRLLTIALLLFSLPSFAQTKFTPGYIVKTNGDTVRGYLQEEIRKDLLYGVKFDRDNNNSSAETFTPANLKAFGYSSGDIFRSVIFTNTLGDSSVSQNCFALLLVEGENNLYSYVNGEKTYFIVSTGGVSIFLYNADYDNNGFVKTEGNYASRLIQMGSRCKTKLYPERIQYGEKEITKFIQELNNCISPNKVSVSHYVKQKMTTQLILLASGLPLGDKYQLAFDGLVRFTTPQISKNAFLNVGAHYSYIHKYSDVIYGTYKYRRTTNYTDISVPVTFQYSFFSGFLKPFVEAGFGLGYFKQEFSNANLFWVPYEPSSSGFAATIIGGVGIEAYVLKGLFIRADWRYEFLIQYPSIGIAYQLK